MAIIAVEEVYQTRGKLLHPVVNGRRDELTHRVGRDISVQTRETRGDRDLVPHGTP